MQSELIESNNKIRAIEVEKQSLFEEIAVKKQEVKHLNYQLQQISDITMVSH